jgi:hypothetical protein
MKSLNCMDLVTIPGHLSSPSVFSGNHSGAPELYRSGNPSGAPEFTHGF